MTVVVWVVENTWQACVRAARQRLADGEEVLLLHVSPIEVEQAARAAYLGLLGRGHAPSRDPGRAVHEDVEREAEDLLVAAEAELGRPARREHRTGRVEREVVQAALGSDLLVLARDGDQRRLGPRSLAPATRFVVDHAPCPVLLVWPGPAPDQLPEPPPHPAGHQPPPHPPPPSRPPHRRGPARAD